MKNEILICYRGKRSQMEMAKIYNVTQQAWSNWENGINVPAFPIMCRIARDIGKTAEEIFFKRINK